MNGSLLRAFVSGVRQVLAAQLVISVLAIALAGWTLGVTSNLIRERDQLRERVIQLEQALGAAGVVVPEPALVVERSAPDANAYPGSLGLAEPPAAAERGSLAIFGNLFAPAPPLRLVVLHVRADGDRREADAIADALREAGLEVHVRVMPPRDPRPSGYAYFDGRQSGPAAELVARVQDLARQNAFAPWTAQLRGVALPARGEYAPERLDVMLPPLPQAPPSPVPAQTPG
jgi:hypothetical protein